MIWDPNIRLSLEIQRNCATLITSGRPSFCASSHPPCAPHTCRHIGHHRRNSRSTGHWPTKRWHCVWRPRWGPHPLDVWSRHISISGPRGQCFEKSWRVHGGRSPRPPTPCLANFDPRNTATTVDESVPAMLSWGSLPRLCQQPQQRVVPVPPSWCLPLLLIPFLGVWAVSWCWPHWEQHLDVQMIMGWQVSHPSAGQLQLSRKSSGKRSLQSQHNRKNIQTRSWAVQKRRAHTVFSQIKHREKNVSHHR